MKVLVAMDDSKFSQAAVQAVVSQIRPADADLRVLHIVAPFTFSESPQMAAAYAPELQDQMKTGHELVDRAAERLRAEGFKVVPLSTKATSAKRSWSLLRIGKPI